MAINFSSSVVTSTFRALQFFGIVPCVLKKDTRPARCSLGQKLNGHFTESAGNLKLEFSQKMCIWCVALRVIYVAGFSCTFDKAKYLLYISSSFADIMTPVLYFLLVYNALYAPLKWKTNIRLLRLLLKLENRSKKTKKESCKSSNINRFILLSIILMMIYLSYQIFFSRSFLWWEKCFIMFTASYVIALTMLQFLFFKCCCSTMAESVPGIVTPCDQKDLNFFVSTVNKVRKFLHYIMKTSLDYVWSSPYSQISFINFYCPLQIESVKQATIESLGVGVSLLLILGVGVNIAVFYDFLMSTSYFDDLFSAIFFGTMYNTYLFFFCYYAQQFTSKVSSVKFCL